MTIRVRPLSMLFLLSRALLFALPIASFIGTVQASPLLVSTNLKTSCSTTASLLPILNLQYYAIDMVKTGRVTGTGRSRGTGQTSFARSPFGISVSQNGTYVYDLTLSFDRLKAQKSGFYTVWLTTASLDKVKRLGVLDSNGSVTGRVEWNKYLLVLTLESEDDPIATKWSGPIVSRGMSRSGMMHTLAGHGPYETEPCAKYGFGENPTKVGRIQ